MLTWLDRERWTDGDVAAAGVPTDAAEDARRNERDEARLPGMWAKSPQLAAITQAVLEMRLAGTGNGFDVKARQAKLIEHHDRTGEPPPVLRPGMVAVPRRERERATA